MISNLPEPPYYAVIFSSIQMGDDPTYHTMSKRMVELAQQQPGYIGHESYKNPTGHSCTISYWKAESDILRWKQHAEHIVAQELGKQKFYSDYTTRVAKVERHYRK